MAEAKQGKKESKPREMRPSTLLNHIEDYCKANDLGQENTVDELVRSIEQDIITEAKSRG